MADKKSNEFETEQENFWAGKFGDDYLERNIDEPISYNLNLFSSILSKTYKVNSVIEFGSNIGLNLVAIRHLLPESSLSAVEINDNAVNYLHKIKYLDEVHHTSILKFKPKKKYDLCLTKVALIHIEPEKLIDVYDLLYDCTNKYIVICEYYSPNPVQIKYRGYERKLFKRDFAGDMLDRYPDLFLLDYGFAYHRDNHFPQDDLNWFILSK